MKKTLLRGGHIVSAEKVFLSDVLIDTQNVIEEVMENMQGHHDAEIIDVKEKLLFPYLIDCHVHFREPGLTHKATMETEGDAALAGGVGTVCEMPNTIPPTVSAEALAEKVKLASHVDHLKMKFFFGITELSHLEELQKLWSDESVEGKMLRRHVAGVKLYLDHSTGNQKVEEKMLLGIFQTCAELKIPIVAHCEDPEINRSEAEKIKTTLNNRSGDSTIAAPSADHAAVFEPLLRDVSLHSAMRPPQAEKKAIENAIELVRKTGAAFHVAHLSTKGGLDLVRKAKKEKLPVTCEVAPHHLFLTTEDYKTLGALGKMNPPLRSLEDRDALWAGIEDGTVDCISTDHAPHTLEEKNGSNPLEAPSGVPGVEMMLPLLLTVASGSWPHPTSEKPKSVTMKYEDIVRLCSVNPAKIFHLDEDTIVKGSAARYSIVDPKKQWDVERKNLKTKCGWSPYEGWRLRGLFSQ